MAEYIKREDALEIVMRTSGDYVAAWTEIAHMAAADVAEVRHGGWEWKEEWETHPETHRCDLISCGWYCSNCGIELGEYLTEKTGRYVCLDDDYCEPTLGICPNCGARMDQEAAHEVSE